MVFEKGQEIAKEGEDTREFYVLMAGKVGVYKGELKVAEFADKGGVIGEMSAILGEPRTATLKAEEATTLVAVEGNVQKLITEHPDIAEVVMMNLAKNLKKMTNDYRELAETNK